MITSAIVQKALSAIKRRADYVYFFEKLQSPGWIQPLMDAGIFLHPEPPTQKGDYISFQPWPQSRYLARMAKKDPEKVTEVALQIPETENVRVHEDLIDAALAMPPEYSAKFVPKAISWMGKCFYYSLLPEKLAALVKYLIEGDQIEAGFQLAEKLLIILLDPKATIKYNEKEERYRVPPEPISPIGAWEFKEILQIITLPLVTKDANRTILMLCMRLEDAISLSTMREDNQAPEDYSHIWQGAIDSAEDHHREDVKNILVTALKEAAQEFLTKAPTVLPTLVANLEGRKWVIFHRLALHLLLNFGNSFPELVAQRLTQLTLFKDRSVQREYQMLARRFFGSLRQQDQDRILGWIDSGPDMQDWDKETPENSKERYKKYWQRDHLFPLDSDLPPEQRQLFDTLVQEIGEPKPLESINMAFDLTYLGPVSPKTIDDLGQMTNTELIDFLKTWKSPKDPFGPDPDGLSRQLSSLVASDPERFVSDLPHFQELDEPTYVRGLLDGILEVKKEKLFQWEPILDLCQWVVNKPVSIEGRHVTHREADPNWSWARQTIIRLISSGLQEGSNPLPFDLRTQIWPTISVLTKDFTNPGPEDHKQNSGHARDPIGRAINSVRGEAIRLVVTYALWVRRYYETMPDSSQRLAKGFEEMPEVKDVLIRHLNPDYDPSLAIRAVYGQWLPWLILLDSQWTKAHLDNIFPRKDELKPFRQVAWQTYIVFCKPYDNVFDLLQQEYAWAISELGSYEEHRDRYGNPEEHLAQHLMTFYWRGKIDLDLPPNLLPIFYQQGSDIVCADVIEFGGRSLKNTKGEVAGDILDRFKRIWEYRFEGIASDPSINSHFKELSAFGGWFGSKKFKVEWAMSQLLGVLRLTKKVEPDHLVIEYLVETATTIPLESIECLDLMIQGDEEGRHVHIWEKEIRAILTIVKKTGNLETQQVVDALIHKLGAMGYFSYRDLLDIRPNIY